MTAVSPFIYSRTFDAPRDLVWAANTEVEHLAQWFSPPGFELQVVRFDPRQGGEFLYGMEAPNGQTMWGKWIFREIVSPERLVVEVSFTDADGRAVRHPMSVTWPLATLSTTSFIDHGDKTELKLEWVPVDRGEPEIQTFNSAHEGMMRGWNGTYDQLDAYLVTAKA